MFPTWKTLTTSSLLFSATAAALMLTLIGLSRIANAQNGLKPVTQGQTALRFRNDPQRLRVPAALKLRPVDADLTADQQLESARQARTLDGFSTPLISKRAGKFDSRTVTSRAPHQRTKNVPANRQASFESDNGYTPSIPTFPDMLPVGTIENPGDLAYHSESPNDPCPRCGVMCDGCCGPRSWLRQETVPWDLLAQGEYIGPARTAHVPEYRLRVDDLIEFIYRLDGKPSANAYRLEVGDRLQIESLSEENLDREVVIQPDGKISLLLLGEVRAAGRSLSDLQADLEARYREYVQDPAISINPLEINTTAQQLISTVDRRYGVGGQAQIVRVTPAGTIQLPAIGSVPAQGLTLQELKREIENRYARLVTGMEVTPILSERAQRYVYVVGEVLNPGRFTLEGPTTLTQAIALAGSWKVGAYLKHVVVFRRDENWNLMATKLDIRGALNGRTPCPADEIWIRDSDIVIVPQGPILRADNFIELVFTRGIYGVIPLNFGVSFAKLSSI